MFVGACSGKDADSRKGDVVMPYTAPARHGGTGRHRLVVFVEHADGWRNKVID